MNLLTLMTPTVFHSPHHGYRFFANAQNDALSSPVILNGARILCGETDKQNDETEWRIYLLWWHLTAPLITVTDPSHSFRMTLNALLIAAIDSSLLLRMTSYRPPSFWTKQEYCVRKPINRTMKRSEESITPLTPTVFHSPSSDSYKPNRANILSTWISMGL